MKNYLIRFTILMVLLIISSHIGLSQKRDFHLVVLYSNDLHGDIHALAREETIIKDIRKKNTNVLLLDAGDIFANGEENHKRFNGKLEISVMNYLGYDAMVIGNHEFDIIPDYKEEIFLRNINLAKFPVLGANLYKIDSTGKKIRISDIEQYVVKTFENIRVGIIGFTTKDINDIEYIKNYNVEDAILTARQIIPDLEEKSDIFIALTHQKYEKDKELLEKFPAIKAVFGGHDHIIGGVKEQIGIRPIVKLEGEGKHFGRVDLYFEFKKNEWKLKDVRFDHWHLKDIPKDPDVEKIIESISGK